MSDHLADQEQVEQLKNFWRNYGKAIIIGLIVGVLIIAGWRYYQHYETRINTEASVAYEKLLAELPSGSRATIMQDARFIIEHYKKTPYAYQAALILARQAVYDGDYDEAIKQLQWIVDKAKVPALRQSARLRLARVLLAKHEYDRALQVLDTIDDPSYKMAIYEIRGDIFLAKANVPAAKAAYRAALKELGNSDFSYPLLQMKYDDIAGHDTVIEVREKNNKSPLKNTK